MLLSDEEIQERIESPMNLLNRLRQESTPNSRQTNIPGLPPSTKDLGLDDKIDSKLAVGKLRETAAEVMATALRELKIQIPNVQKPEKLAQIAREMNSVLQSRPDEGKVPPQIIVYAPQVIQENHFQELTLRDDI